MNKLPDCALNLLRYSWKDINTYDGLTEEEQECITPEEFLMIKEQLDSSPLGC